MARHLNEYDCVVIGGGPSGATVAAFVADAGHRTLLLERDPEPRRKVGESLMPETYWVFERLGLLDELKQSAFPRKVGVQFVSSSGRESSPFSFRRHDPRECSRTWHVERTKFDPLLLENAAKKGAEIRRGVRVREVVFDNDRAVGVRLTARGGHQADDLIRARVVVDASGHQGLLSARSDLRQFSPEFRKAAIWGHFRGARRDLFEGGVVTMILRTQSNNCWFWHIPLADDVVSIGCIGDASYLLQGRGSPENVFDEEVADCPAIAERLAGSRRVGELEVVKEFSYKDDTLGRRWLGLRRRFVGLYRSDLFLGRVVCAQIGRAGGRRDRGGFEARAICRRRSSASGFPSSARGTNWIRKLVRAFYSGQFHVGKFVAEYPPTPGQRSPTCSSAASFTPMRVTSSTISIPGSNG